MRTMTSAATLTNDQRDVLRREARENFRASRAAFDAFLHVARRVLSGHVAEPLFVETMRRLHHLDQQVDDEVDLAEAHARFHKRHGWLLGIKTVVDGGDLDQREAALRPLARLLVQLSAARRRLEQT